MTTFSPLEIAFIAAAALTVLLLNLFATHRISRYFGAFHLYGLGYLALTWFVPIAGALFVLATLRGRTRTRFTPFDNGPIVIDPPTIASQTGNWPTISDFGRKR